MPTAESLWERVMEASVAADRALAAVRPLRLAIATVGPRAGGKSALLNALLSDDALETGEPQGPVAQVVRAERGATADNLPDRWCRGEAVVVTKGRWFLPADTDLVEIRAEADGDWDWIGEWLPECLALVYITPPLGIADPLLSRVAAALGAAVPLICVISKCDTVSPDEVRRVREFLRDVLPDPLRTHLSVYCASLESEHAKLDVLPLEDELVAYAADRANRQRAVRAQARRVLRRASSVVAGDLEQMDRKIAESQRQCAEGEEALEQTTDEFAALVEDARRVSIGIGDRFSARTAQAMASLQSGIEAAVSAPGASLTGDDLRDLISDGVKNAWIGATTDAAEEFDEFVRVCRKRLNALAAENVAFSPPFGPAGIEPDLRPTARDLERSQASNLALGGVSIGIQN